MLFLLRSTLNSGYVLLSDPDVLLFCNHQPFKPQNDIMGYCQGVPNEVGCFMYRKQRFIQFLNSFYAMMLLGE